MNNTPNRRRWWGGLTTSNELDPWHRHYADSSGTRQLGAPHPLVLWAYARAHAHTHAPIVANKAHGPALPAERKALAMMAEDELLALVGHRFPGGRYRIAHWENWLLTNCTGRDPMPDELAHPVVMFHAPILGAGTSISELFTLGHAAGAGSVGLESYDWEYFRPLREEVEYSVTGGIVEAERTTSETGAVVDRMAFRIEFRDHDDLVARVTNRWKFRRTAP